MGRRNRFQRDAYRPEDVPIYRYTYLNPGIFAQDDIQAATWLTFSVSARWTFTANTTRYSAHASPCSCVAWLGEPASLLAKGFSAPSALTEETEAAGLKRLVVPSPFKVERGRGLTFDLTRSWRTFTATTTLFASNVHHPLYVEQTTAYTLTESRCLHKNLGVESVGMWRRRRVLRNSLLHMDTRPGDARSVRQDVELTPRNTAGLVGTWERENNCASGSKPITRHAAS